MRQLLYVPIIHNEADLGSLAPGIEKQATATIGVSNWQKHKEIVHLYWQTLAHYWEGREAAGLKIFQDGMAADGIVGKNIVKSLANDGSINHKIIEQLLEKGAELIKTEDPALIKEEYFLTRELAETNSRNIRSLTRYRWQKDKILKERDAYIIRMIDENLQDGQKGVCFLGAYHQIVSILPDDIQVIALKDPEKVRAYSQKYTRKQWESEVSRLGSYLIAPIEIETGETHEY